MALHGRTAPGRIARAALAIALVVASASALTSAPAQAESALHERLATYKKSFDRWDRATDPLSVDIAAAEALLDSRTPEANRATFASLSRRTTRARRKLERIRTPRQMRRVHRRFSTGVRRVAVDLSEISAAAGRSDALATSRATDALIRHFERSDAIERTLRARLRRLLAAS